jgi:ferredoxin
VCPANSAEANEQIGKALGIDLSGGKPVVCAVKCQGNSAVSKMTATYHGIEDCWAAMQTLHGTKVCPFSCIGLGSCVSACKYGALEIVDGMVAVDSDLCVGCGLCIKTCPVQVLELQDKWSWRYYVACNSKDKGAVTRKYCEVGCIGCKQCEKVCPADAVKVENFCAVIDQDTCVACGLCIEECPTKAIVLKHDAIKAKES